MSASACDRANEGALENSTPSPNASILPAPLSSAETPGQCPRGELRTLRAHVQSRGARRRNLRSPTVAHRSGARRRPAAAERRDRRLARRRVALCRSRPPPEVPGDEPGGHRRRPQADGAAHDLELSPRRAHARRLRFARASRFAREPRSAHAPIATGTCSFGPTRRVTASCRSAPCARCSASAASTPFRSSALSRKRARDGPRRLGFPTRKWDVATRSGKLSLEHGAHRRRGRKRRAALPLSFGVHRPRSAGRAVRDRRGTAASPVHVATRRRRRVRSRRRRREGRAITVGPRRSAGGQRVYTGELAARRRRGVLDQRRARRLPPARRRSGAAARRRSATRGAALHNATDVARYLFLDGVPVAGSTPDRDQLVLGPPRGRYQCSGARFSAKRASRPSPSKYRRASPSAPAPTAGAECAVET